MLKFRKRRLAGILLSSLFCISMMGCGNKPAEVDDYGSGAGDEAATENNAENDGDTGVPSAQSLSEMLGGTALKYNNSFSLGDKQVTVDVAYDIKGTETPSEYLVDFVKEDQFDEQSIVNSFFGDTGVPCEKDYMLDRESGDSNYTIIASQMIAFDNTNSGDSVTSWESQGAAWVDEPNYYIHTYNGTYREADYQLLISYSQDNDELVVVLFPKDIAALAGDPSYEYMDFSGVDGRFTNYYKNSLKEFTIDEVMADRPNKCSLSDDQVIDTAVKSIKESVGIDYPGDAFSMSSDLYNPSFDYGADAHKLEILYYPESALSSSDFEGAERNGYALSALGSLDNIKVMTNTTSTVDSVSLYNNGFVGIDDKGVVALYITLKYNFKDKTVENVKVLSFNEAMDAFVNEAPDNLDLSKEEKLDNSVTFNSVQLVYFPVAKEGSTNEYRLVPAWCLDALGSDGWTVVRVLINAEDGSYITTLYSRLRLFGRLFLRESKFATITPVLWLWR